MAEALLNRCGNNKFNAFSASSRPKGKIHPETIAVLEKNNLDGQGFRSKSWDEFTGPDASEIDLVITVCSNTANETCPVFPVMPLSAHWDIDDPAREFDSEEKQNSAFQRVFKKIELRIQSLTSLFDDDVDKSALHERLQQLSDPA